MQQWSPWRGQGLNSFPSVQEPPHLRTSSYTTVEESSGLLFSDDYGLAYLPGNLNFFRSVLDILPHPPTYTTAPHNLKEL
jgi:hypothetical protein